MKKMDGTALLSFEDAAQLGRALMGMPLHAGQAPHKGIRIEKKPDGYYYEFIPEDAS